MARNPGGFLARLINPILARGTPGGAVPPPARESVGSLAAVVLAFACIAIYIALMTLFKMSNNDIWIHLKTGEYVLKNGWVPIQDPYSFVAADRNYVAHEWLSGVIFYVVYSSFGVVGLIFFKGIVIAAACGFLLDTARLLRARLSIILPAFTLMLYISSARFLERPHIFSYLMTALYLWLFFRWRETGRRRLWLWIIVPAHTIWTNLHGGFVQGLAILATFALGETLIWARASRLGTGGEKMAAPADLKLLWGLVPACIAASLINPYGYRLLLFPFQLTGLQLFMGSVYEWMPPFHIAYNSSTMFFFYIMQVGTLCVAFFMSQRDRAPSRTGGNALALANSAFVTALAATCLLFAWLYFQRPPPEWKPEVLRAMLFFMLGVFCVFSVVNLRNLDFTEAGLILLFYLLSLRHNRAVTDAAMGTFPILAGAASAVLDLRGHASATVNQAPTKPLFQDRSSPAAVVIGSLIMLAVSAHAAIYTYYLDFDGSGREKGLGISDNMPACAVGFIERNRLTGNVFVSYTFAAMLIHRMWPSVKVNMDSRNDVYGEELYGEYRNALSDPYSMSVYLRKHPIDFFLLSYGDLVPAVFSMLEATQEWALVYIDDLSFVMVRRKPGHEDFIRREEFRAIPAVVMGDSSVEAHNAAQVLEEAERAIRNCPGSIFGFFYKSKALNLMGRFEEAIAVCRQILERDPRNPLPYAEMGFAYAGLDQRDQAIEMFRKAVELDPGSDLARENLRKLQGP